MSNGSGGKKKILLVAVLMALVAGAAVVGVLGVKEGWLKSGEAQVGKIARHLPKETMFVAWTGKVGTFVDMAEQVGLTSESLKEMSFQYRNLLEKLGFDPLSKAGLDHVGLDMSGPIGVALTPSAKADLMVMVYVPMIAGKSGVALVRQIVEAVAPEKMEFAEGQENGKNALWLRFADMGEGGHAAGACLEVDGGMFVVFPGDYRSRHAAEIEIELQKLVADLAGVGGKLSDSADYAAAIKGCDNELFGAVFLTGPARQLLLKGGDDMAALIPALADLSSAGAFVTEEGTGMHFTMTAVAREGVVPYGRERDLSALGFVAGQPLIGTHFAVDAGRLLTAFETALGADKRAWKEYKRGMEEITEELKLPPGTRVDQVWNGELGFFISELSENPDALVRGVLAFVGLADEELAIRILDTLMFKAGDMMTRGKVGDSTIFRVDADGVTVALLVHQGRLWVSGSVPALEEIASGNQAGALDKDRLGKIAGVLKDSDNFSAIYADLEQIILRVPAMMSKRDRRDMESVWPLLSKLDYVTFETYQEGRTTVSVASVYVKSGTITEAVLELAGSALGMEFSKYSRKAKTAEAIDMLDKLYKGAADYYSTPRVREYDASKLDCQFPADQALTPAPGNCCGSLGGPDADGDGKCDADWTAWDSATWYALKFAITEHHYCVYSFDQNEKTGADAQFTANAHCDLDCDGTLSTFQRYGKGDPSVTRGECGIMSAAALFTQNELE